MCWLLRGLQCKRAGEDKVHGHRLARRRPLGEPAGGMCGPGQSSQPELRCSPGRPGPQKAHCGVWEARARQTR